MPKGWPKGRSGREEEKAVKHSSPVVFLSEQRWNSSKFHQMEILELKRTVSEMKVILDRYTRMLQPIKEKSLYTWRQINRNYPFWRTERKNKNNWKPASGVEGTIWGDNQVVTHDSGVFIFSCVWLFATPWTAACLTPWSMEFFRQEILEWVAIFLLQGILRPRDQTHISTASAQAGRFFTTCATLEVELWRKGSEILGLKKNLKK